jgi:hypothetical protein
LEGVLRRREERQSRAIRRERPSEGFQRRQSRAIRRERPSEGFQRRHRMYARQETESSLRSIAPMRSNDSTIVDT